MGPLGHVGLALSTSLTMLFNFAQLSFFLRPRLKRLEGRRIAATFARTALASAAMALVVRAAVYFTEPWWRSGTVASGLLVFAGIAVGSGLTWAFYRIARVEELPELEEAVAGLGRRLGLSRPRSPDGPR